jgi:hypothetical protein
MKDRVLKEFKKREKITGAGKLKWDAQVKMRQTKLMAAGQKVGRIYIYICTYIHIHICVYTYT